MALGLHQFAEGLARHVDVAEQLATGVAPAGEPAFEQSHVAVAEFAQALGGDPGQAFAIVIDGDRGIAAGYSGENFQFQLRQRDVGGEQRVRLGERVFLADVDQGHLAAIEQGGADIVEGAMGDLTH
ncbi:hypothetical protein D3C81_1660000 [compost metagenome]